MSLDRLLRYRRRCCKTLWHWLPQRLFLINNRSRLPSLRNRHNRSLLPVRTVGAQCSTFSFKRFSPCFLFLGLSLFDSPLFLRALSPDDAAPERAILCRTVKSGKRRKTEKGGECNKTLQKGGDSEILFPFRKNILRREHVNFWRLLFQFLSKIRVISYFPIPKTALFPT